MRSKVILAGIDPTFTIENIDKGSFILRDFQDKLAANASRFQSKKYTPDSRILTYLKVRAQEFNVPVPSFMKKRLPEKGKGSQPSKRGRSNMQQNREHIFSNRCLLLVLRFLPPPLRRQHFICPKCLLLMFTRCMYTCYLLPSRGS